MLLVTVICVLIAALNAGLVWLWQRRSVRAPVIRHEKVLYAAFIADVERRLAAGEIDADLAQEERVEAARALLKADEQAQTPAIIKPIYGFAALMVVAGLSFGLYLMIGHPNMPDQPYADRLKSWTRLAKIDRDQVPPQAMAAVLRQGQAEHAKEVAYWLLLGRIDMLAGNNYQGAQDYEKAQKLAPDTFPAWSELGEALTFVGGKTGPDARQAFDKALALNPADARAHYYLGHADIAEGHYDTGRAHFEAALKALPVSDPGYRQVVDEMKGIAPAETAAQAMQARISGMVASLAAQLKANPDNPDGWARLLRSYDVLNDSSAKATAVKAMQAHYHDHPEIAASILVKSSSTVGAENTGGMQ